LHTLTFVKKLTVHLQGIVDLKTSKKRKMNTILTFDRLPIAVAQIGEQLNRIELYLKKPLEPVRPQRLDSNGVLNYINESGYVYSTSKFQKDTAAGKIPCKKFNNRLVFDKCEIDNWLESQTKAVGQSAAAMTLAADANRKLRRS